MANQPDPRPRPPSIDWGKLWRDDRLRTDQVIWGLIAINVVVYVLWQVPELWSFMRAQFEVSLESVSHLRVWTMLTSEFSHMEPMHLLFNMFGLWVFGRPIGQIRGAREVLQVYVVGAIVASFAHVLFTAVVGQDVRALGASGAVMALAAYYGGMFPDRTLLVGFIFPMPAALAVALFILADVFGMMSSQSTIAHAAHLGGAAYGLLHYQLFVQDRKR